VRTALSALTIAFGLLTLAEDAKKDWLAISIYVCGEEGGRGVEYMVGYGTARFTWFGPSNMCFGRVGLYAGVRLSGRELHGA